ncbi:dTMP kinase [Epidermidibacterium keratini]|uniref:dTMP kinase n=1 Tax=Epidermidibacterium keratini TaxID=1891644 RepID=UPI001CEF5C0C|nr:dTMP kinase [Epidermidibacterium keratini]
MPGLFITFEGGEGAGKSTQIARLAQHLEAEGREVIVTFEPGGTPLGKEVRRLVLSPDSHVTPRSEALLYAADRAHHVDTVIEPALAADKVVICDRYVDSTYAYQGAGRALALDDVRTVMQFAVAGRIPDLTVLLDIDPLEGLRRARGDGTGDRIEAEGLEFHQAVRRGFLALAAAEPERFVVLDASGTPERIAAAIADVVEERVR